ncbi:MULTISPECIES: MinD/ParA family ATP-binding protein [Haloarcula]|uniref:MinD/ParA family ATP-binding protein n=1 Tax=Haloarcula TaxID=2237 RepID=UPI0023EC0310|nr:P-loop NTPase [Halomicroarcula sp. XH51]
MLAIAGGKGGCGKTTTALGIARAMARAGRRPVVVDTDLDMPDLHRRAGVSRAPGVAAAADRDAPLATARASPRVAGVDVLPGAGASAAALASVLDALDASVRPVLLDCPAGAGPDGATPLRAADRCVLVSTPTRQSLLDAVKTAAMARQLDAPPALTAVSRSDGAVDPAPLLGSQPAVHVPDVSLPPLEAEEPAAQYRSMAKTLYSRNA